MDLSLNIRAFVAQRLIPRRDGRGRVPAVEVMLNSPLISDLIFKGDVSGIKEIMKKSRELGMQTFDQSLFDLVRRPASSATRTRCATRTRSTTCGSRSSCTARKRRAATSSPASAASTWCLEQTQRSRSGREAGGPASALCIGYWSAR